MGPRSTLRSSDSRRLFAAPPTWAGPPGPTDSSCLMHPVSSVRADTYADRKLDARVVPLMRDRRGFETLVCSTTNVGRASRPDRFVLFDAPRQLSSSGHSCGQEARCTRRAAHARPQGRSFGNAGMATSPGRHRAKQREGRFRGSFSSNHREHDRSALHVHVPIHRTVHGRRLVCRLPRFEPASRSVRLHSRGSSGTWSAVRRHE